jgi:hypothetical protein
MGRSNILTRVRGVADVAAAGAGLRFGEEGGRVAMCATRLGA